MAHTGEENSAGGKVTADDVTSFADSENTEKTFAAIELQKSEQDCFNQSSTTATDFFMCLVIAFDI